MLQINNIKLSIKQDDSELSTNVAYKLGINSDDILSLRVLKRSIDARNKNNIFFIYSVVADIANEKALLKKNNKDIVLFTENNYSFEPSGAIQLNSRPVVVGSGPAGLFCAYNLAYFGYKPLILERGEQVEKRTNTVKRFFESNHLNIESNVQFGEGGAGTFSDGKLNTLIKDESGRIRFVYETFVKFGAPESILWQNKPHIGTDNLQKILVNMRKEIERLGGKFLFDTCMENVLVRNNQVKAIMTLDTWDIGCEVIVAAIGHSARDTFRMLRLKGLNMIQKPFAIGMRIEHKQETISRAQYGENYSYLPPADYKLAYKASNGRGVYSFCMCPGGFVVNASSEEEMIAVNGMSNYLRDGMNANSAIVVTVDEKDFGSNQPLAGMEFQRKIERLAYKAGNGVIPTQRFGDFKDDHPTCAYGRIKPKHQGLTMPTKLNGYLNSDITNAFLEGMDKFGRMIEGFSCDDALLSGFETRTSSPIRILRNENYESNISGFYPCGEGAGYAGGITSSAVDGLKVSEAIMKKYKPATNIFF